MQNFTANLLVIKDSVFERFGITYSRNIEDGSWHALREGYEGANFSAKKVQENV
jgi:hypothetical protein